MILLIPDVDINNNSPLQTKSNVIQKSITELSIVIPTYNEKTNLKKLINQMRENLKYFLNYEIIIIDDNSPDGTGILADTLSYQFEGVKVIHRPIKMGLASALFEGVNHSKGKFILISDADLQHSPNLIRKFLEEKNNGADIIVASRYIKDSQIAGWSVIRQIISKTAITIAHILLPKTRPIKDPISGYFLFKKNIISTELLTGLSWKILLEIIVHNQGKEIVEIPFQFKERIDGKSKIRIIDFFEYLVLIFKLMKYSK